MSDKPSLSTIRIALAQFACKHNIDLQDLYEALGVDMEAADQPSLSHFAGIMDGINLATTQIKEKGLVD
ncbi:MAG: hypothetical protein ACWA5L_04325 [bacterium]